MLEQVRQPSSSGSALAGGRWSAERAATKRASARRSIHARVLHPIDVPHLVRDPLVRRRSPVASVFAALRLLAAALGVHLVGLIVLAAAGRLVPERPRHASAKPLTVRVLDAAPRDLGALAPVESEPSRPVATEPPQPMPEPPKALPEPPRPKPPPKQQPRPAKTALPSTPSEPTSHDAESAGSAEPLPLIGLSLESTVSGSGPNFVTGTSGMGETPVNTPQAGAASSNPTPTGSSGAGSIAVGAQRAATRIPTRDEKLEKPRRLELREPPYPATLRAQGIEGDVLVTVSIDPRGVVQRASVLRGSGHPEFDAAALNAARAERFAPAQRDGVPVPYTLSYTYRFRIED